MFFAQKHDDVTSFLLRVVSSKGLLRKLEIRVGGGGGILELGNPGRKGGF